jgi:hypothetical protein
MTASSEWLLTAVFAVGFAVISFLLSHWFRRIENTLGLIWKEIKESRTTESRLMTWISKIEARCEERHK